MENQEHYTKTFSTFSGSDIVMYLNEQVVTAFERIEFDEDLKTGKVDGFVDITVLAGDYQRIKESIIGEGDKNILLKYVNEHNGRGEAFIKYVSFTKRKIINSIDGASFSHRYYFEAQSVNEYFN